MKTVSKKNIVKAAYKVTRRDTSYRISVTRVIVPSLGIVRSTQSRRVASQCTRLNVPTLYMLE